MELDELLEKQAALIGRLETSLDINAVRELNIVNYKIEVARRRHRWSKAGGIVEHSVADIRSNQFHQHS